MLELFTLNLRDDVRVANARGKMQNAECKTRTARWNSTGESVVEIGPTSVEGGKGVRMGSETCGARQIRSIGNQDEPL